ncbi:MAG: hypothetical protein KBD50_00130 [Candidatus Pacebacteria bacterium]|nr:hypothetical protein [Candidatus Paceibacterota bacterium]
MYLESPTGGGGGSPRHLPTEDQSPSLIYRLVLPAAGLVCLALWVLAIWKVADLVGTT